MAPLTTLTLQTVEQGPPWNPPDEPEKDIPVHICTFTDVGGNLDTGKITGFGSYAAGQQVVAEVKKSKFGTSIKVDKEATKNLGAQPAPAQGLPPAPSNGPAARSVQAQAPIDQPAGLPQDRRQRMITRQHSQAQALAYHALEVQKGAELSLERVKALTDGFDRDVFGV